MDQFEKQNPDIAVHVLSVTDKNELIILRRSQHNNRKHVVHLLLLHDGDKRHYATIKSLSR